MPTSRAALCNLASERRNSVSAGKVDEASVLDRLRDQQDRAERASDLRSKPLPDANTNHLARVARLRGLLARTRSGRGPGRAQSPASETHGDLDVDDHVEFLHATEAPAESSRERLPSLADAERAHIARVLESVNWNKKQAAAVLEISRGTLYRKIVEYGLEPEARLSRNRSDD